MKLKCAVGLHDWVACKCSQCGKSRDEGHAWQGCKCFKCGKTRDEGHDWKKDCEKCTRCGRTSNMHHAWENREKGLSVCIGCRKWEVSAEYVMSRDHEGWTPLHRVAE